MQLQQMSERKAHCDYGVCYIWYAIYNRMTVMKHADSLFSLYPSTYYQQKLDNCDSLLLADLLSDEATEKSAALLMIDDSAEAGPSSGDER